MSSSRRPHERGGKRRPSAGGASSSAGPTPARRLPYRVIRWGKFWSLEPLFADVRTYLVARGGLPPRLDDIVLAEPIHGDRRRIVEVLGRADDLRAVLRALLYAQDLPQGFSPRVLDEAAAVRPRTTTDDHGRVDLTQLPTFTIDPDTARDFDDAISVAREADGYRAHVHIADVSYFVDEGGEIDRSARLRTSSVYLPLFAEPMLPAALSSDLCSLVPRVSRKCLTVEFTFSLDGRRRSTRLYRSVISSDHRLTYGVVDAVLEGGTTAAAASPHEVPDATVNPDAELTASLRLAAELAGVLRRRRQARGALALGSFEPEYVFDEAGELTGAVARPETPSHALVEEFMLAANEAVAEFLLRKRARALYRVHQPPEAASLRGLLGQLEELGVQTPPFPSAEFVPAEQLAEVYGRLIGIINSVVEREKRGRSAWPSLLLRSLKQARYDATNLGHFGLASPAYLHFTSPIRRYPDLVVHRSLLFHLGEGGGELDEAELVSVAESCSSREREVARLELRADDVALSFLLKKLLDAEGWEQVFTGEIEGLLGGGLFVRFAGVFRGFLSSRRLGGERFEVSEYETALVGQGTGRRYRLGDAITVRVERVDRLTGKVDLAPEGESARGLAARTPRHPAPRGSRTRGPHRRSPASGGRPRR